MLRRCLQSLINLDYPDYEIIVVDGGSIDGTPEMVKKEFPNVILIIKPDANIGESINLGAKIAKGEIIGFDLNNDETFEPLWLKKLVNALLSSPDIGVVGGTRVKYGTELIDEAGVKFNYFGIPWSNIKLKLKDLPKGIQEVDYVGIPIVRKEVFEMIGGCDESYEIFYEDSDFCLKVKKAGLKVCWVPDAISYHEREATIGKSSEKVLYMQLRNKIKFLLIHFSLPRLPLALTYELIVLPVLRILFTLMFKMNPSLWQQSRARFLLVPSVGRFLLLYFRSLVWNLKTFKITMMKRRALPKTLNYD